jgi:hypothetical protein
LTVFPRKAKAKQTVPQGGRVIPPTPYLNCKKVTTPVITSNFIHKFLIFGGLDGRRLGEPIFHRDRQLDQDDSTPQTGKNAYIRSHSGNSNIGGEKVIWGHPVSKNLPITCFMK